VNSTEQTNRLPAEESTKQSPPNRRNFLGLAALGAVAAVAVSVLPSSEIAVAQNERRARKMRSLGERHAAAEGKQVRKAGTLRSEGELGAPRTTGMRSQKPAERAAAKVTKTAKAGPGERAASTRQAARTKIAKAMKAPKSSG
jgi:hypothetical protein